MVVLLARLALLLPGAEGIYVPGAGSGRAELTRHLAEHEAIGYPRSE
jgi:hypothetical protein